MSINTLQEKFEHGLGDIYDAEHRFLDAHQEMLGQVKDETLRSRLERHVEETRGHIARLEKVFGLLGKPPERIPCEVAKGLVRESRATTGEATADADVLDSVLATMMSKVEGYEMATYRALITDAKELGHDEAARLLRQILKEEQATSDAVDKAAPRLADEARDEPDAEATR